VYAGQLSVAVDVKPPHVTAVEAEGVFRGLIDERLSFEVFDDPVHVNDQGAVDGSGNLQRLDVRIDDRPFEIRASAKVSTNAVQLSMCQLLPAQSLGAD
jgi:hypothetical protein